MEFQGIFSVLASKTIDPRVMPRIGPIPPKTAKLNVIEMRLFTVPEYEHEFVPGSVERSHAAVALDPDAKVKKVAPRGVSRGEHFAHVSPIHTCVDHSACHGVGTYRRQRRSQETRKLLLGHFARCHCEFTMRNASIAADMTVDWDVVRSVREYGRGLLGFHQGGVSGRIEGVTAIEAVRAEQP